MTSFRRDGVAMAYCDVGIGVPFLFQHGLGGDDAQVSDVCPAIPAVRRITLECRGQGKSEFGSLAQLSISTFAGDLEALADELAVGAAVVGGISMGAAIALRLAVRSPGRVRALVLARPAWVTASAPANMQPYALVGDLMRQHEPKEALQRFGASEIAADLARQAPDNLATLRGFFSRTDPVAFGGLLKAIAADGPGVSEYDLREIGVPTLVIGHGSDLAHPLAYAEALARLIPGATLRTITAKAKDREAYRHDFRAALGEFLGKFA